MAGMRQENEDCLAQRRGDAEERERRDFLRCAVASWRAKLFLLENQRRKRLSPAAARRRGAQRKDYLLCVAAPRQAKL